MLFEQELLICQNPCSTPKWEIERHKLKKIAKIIILEIKLKFFLKIKKNKDVKIIK